MRLDELTEADAHAIARWRYPSPYDCYDAPSWEQMGREGWALCDDQTRRTQFLALRPDSAGGTDAAEPAEPGELAGFVRFRPAGESLALHLGLRPELCGHGLGAVFLDLVLAEARRRASGQPVTLQVRRFNARAIAAYRRAGFRLVTPAETPRSPAVERDPQERLAMALSD